MGARWLAALAVTVAVVVLCLGTVTWLGQSPDFGFTLAQRDGQYVVETVSPGGLAQRAGLEAGAILSTVDGATVRGLPLGWEWAVASAGFRQQGHIVNFDLAGPRVAFNRAPISLLAGLAILVGGLWWLRAALSPDLRTVGVALAVASAVPLLIGPVTAQGAPIGQALTWAAPVGASGLLAVAVATLLPSRRRRVALGICFSLAIAAILVGIAPLVSVSATALEVAAWLALALLPLVPVAIAVRSRRLRQTRFAAGESVSASWLLAAACLPGIAVLAGGSILSGAPVAASALAAWIVGLIVWNAFDHRLARARLQRDVVVTVTEAERARLAAELHDVALQELTLLVRRLDATGDVPAAEAARSVAERLRELCGDLHLPILDELGAGPALEWLVGRIAATTGEDVRLELFDQGRPPAGVELAVFRVAQEALSNATRHAIPPIEVRYVSSATSASLSVNDAGPKGHAHDGVAARPGHFGLATMQQRAEQIGALLSIRPWPGGGTRVSLEWRAS